MLSSISIQTKYRRSLSWRPIFEVIHILKMNWGIFSTSSILSFCVRSIPSRSDFILYVCKISSPTYLIQMLAFERNAHQTNAIRRKGSLNYKHMHIKRNVHIFAYMRLYICNMLSSVDLMNVASKCALQNAACGTK